MKRSSHFRNKKEFGDDNLAKILSGYLDSKKGRNYPTHSRNRAGELTLFELNFLLGIVSIVLAIFLIVLVSKFGFKNIGYSLLMLPISLLISKIWQNRNSRGSLFRRESLVMCLSLTLALIYFQLNNMEIFWTCFVIAILAAVFTEWIFSLLCDKGGGKDDGGY